MDFTDILEISKNIGGYFDKNIGGYFDKNIGGYFDKNISGYFDKNIGNAKINKNTLKFLEILCWTIKKSINKQIYTC